MEQEAIAMGTYDLESEAHLSPCHRNLFAIVSLLIIILTIYSDTFHASWHFDDVPNILKNEPLHLEELGWQNIKKTFFASLDGRKKMYRPVACFSLALNYYLGKDDVFGYHLVNIFVHFLSSIFLFLFIFHTLNLPLVKARYAPNSYFVALLATVLWAINPLQTQAVTYIVQRMASMAGMFYIMSMYFYLKGRSSEHRVVKFIHFSMCLVAASLAFGSKENTAMLPMSILLFDLFLLQGIRRENIKRSSVVFLALLSIPICAALVLKGSSLFPTESLLSRYEERSFTLGERLLTEPRIVLFYITLLLYPMPDRLCINHYVPISHSLIDPPTTLLAILTILSVIGVAILKSKKWPFLSYCVIFYFLNHLIESTILPLELTFEHRNYIPSMLSFVPLSFLLLKALQFFSYKRSMKVILTTFITLALIAQGHSTFIRNFIWKTEESLWLDAIDKYPNLPRAHHNLGKYYGDTGQKQKAIAEYEEALRLKRGSHAETHHLTHFNLALIYASMNQDDKAIEHLESAIQIVPHYADAYNNLAIIKAKRGKYDEAYDLLIKSLTYDRGSSQAHNNLGYVLLKTNRIGEAINEFKKALDLKAGDRTALHNLGVAYKYAEELDKSEKCFRAVLAQDPKALLTRLHLAETVYLRGREELARDIVSHTLDILPPQVIYSKMKVFFQEDSFEVLPDMSIVLPLIKDAYLTRSDSLKKMGDELGSLVGNSED